MADLCRRGHPMTQKNSRPLKHRSGRLYFTCRRCESAKRKAKYAGDPAYRAMIRTNYVRWRERHGLVKPTIDAIMALVVADLAQMLRGGT